MRFSRTRCKQQRQAMAAAELLMAIGLLFTTAWAFLRLGSFAYLAYLHLILNCVYWPFG